jgi:sialidase-1
MPPLTLLSSGLIYRNPKPYLRSRQAFHPSLVGLDDSELVCSFDIGEGVESLDYRTHLSRSTDGGKTWTLEGPIFEDPIAAGATHSIRLSRLSDGSLVGFGARWHRLDAEQGIVSRETDGFAPMDLFLIRSTDSGRSWGEPQPLDPPVANPAFEVCHGVVELPDGAWLVPTATCKGWDGSLPAGEQAVLFRSEDQGESWPSHASTFRQSGVNYWEQSVVPLGGDRLLAVGWAHEFTTGRNLPTPYVLSDDGGKTFSSPLETGFLGQTCKALHLGDDRLLCVYRRSDRPGLWATLARLNGGAWCNINELPLWGAGLASSGMEGEAGTYDELSELHFGYPSLDRTSGNEVLVAFWCLEGWTCSIRWIRIGLGKDGD